MVLLVLLVQAMVLVDTWCVVGWPKPSNPAPNKSPSPRPPSSRMDFDDVAVEAPEEEDMEEVDDDVADVAAE